MTFLPIVERELRVAARNRATSRGRVAVVLIAGVMVSFMLLTAGAGARNAGGGMFQFLSVLAFLYCLFEGTRLTADCLSEEKREGTIGLLFLTDLKGYDVVLGKLVSTSLRSFYGLLGALPLLSMPLFVGGVSPGEFWRMALVLLNTLFLSLAAGMCVSALSRSDRKAWAGTIGLLLTLLFMPRLVDAILRGVSATSGFLFSYASPGFGFHRVFDTLYRLHQGELWLCLTTTHLIGWCLLIAASLVLPRAWQERAVAEVPSRWQPRWDRWNRGQPVRRARLRKLLLEVNPVYWLAVRRSGSRVVLWGVVAATAVLWAIVGLTMTSAGGVPATPFLGALSVIGLLFRVVPVAWVGALACYHMADLRRDGGLQLVLATSLSSAEVVRGQVMAIKRQALAPVIVLAVSQFAFTVTPLLFRGVRSGGGLDLASTLLFFGGAWALEVVAFVFDLLAVGAVGLWLGLVDRKPGPALAKALLYVLIVPSFMCFCSLARLVTDAIFFTWARTRLLSEFREAATRSASGELEGVGWWIFKSYRTKQEAPPATTTET